MKGRRLSPQSLGKSSPGKRAVKSKGPKGSVSFRCSRNIETDVTVVRREGQDWTVAVFSVLTVEGPLGVVTPLLPQPGNHTEASTVWIWRYQVVKVG